MKNKITEKINERLLYDRISEDTYFIVGAEIRSRRYRLEMTLEALADGVCSLSYLCKIENSKIQPNREFLKELCERLELSSEQVDTLLSLRDALIKCVNGFLNNKGNSIDYYFEKGKDFDNYRYSIIKFIYYIFHHDMIGANKEYLDLIQIAQTMREFDFIIFSLFSAILHYYNFRFNEAIQILEDLDKFDLDSNLETLRSIYLFKASFGANKQDTIVHYSNTKVMLIDRGSYELLDEMRYILCIYYVKNDNYYLLSKEIDSIRNDKYRESLYLIKNFKEKNVSKIMNYSSKHLSEYAKMLKLYVTDFDSFKNVLSKVDNEYYVYDYDYNYLTILNARYDEKYSNILFSEIIPRICNTDDNYIKHFVLNEVASINCNNKNRSLIRAYYLLFGYDTGFSNFDIGGEE